MLWPLASYLRTTNGIYTTRKQFEHLSIQHEKALLSIIWCFAAWEQLKIVVLKYLKYDRNLNNTVVSCE